MSYTRDQFEDHISDLYQHLYDLVYLRTHPLTDLFIPNPEVRRKDKAWQLHELLLDVIEELNPGPEAPAFSRAWRRHRLMVQRYKNGKEPAEIWQEIAVSRRQYYREHRAALKAIAEILWGRYVAAQATDDAPVAESTPPRAPDEASVTSSGEDAPSLTHQELLRREVARAAHADRNADLDEVLDGVVALLGARMRQRGMTLARPSVKALPSVAVERGLLRQLLLGVVGYLIERAEDATLHVRSALEEGALRLVVRIEPALAVVDEAPSQVSERLAGLEELAALSRAHITPCYAGEALVGFDLLLPTDPQVTILVVDDNEDVLELFRRFLMPQRYRVITAQRAAQALTLAAQLQPHIITLDLMMPEQDGWDVLQTLRHQPETQHIPVVVCSVLKQKELALSLGAAAFLEKPVTEQALRSALATLLS